MQTTHQTNLIWQRGPGTTSHGDVSGWLAQCAIAKRFWAAQKDKADSLCALEIAELSTGTGWFDLAVF